MRIPQTEHKYNFPKITFRQTFGAHFKPKLKRCTSDTHLGHLAASPPSATTRLMMMAIIEHGHTLNTWAVRYTMFAHTRRPLPTIRAIFPGKFSGKSPAHTHRSRPTVDNDPMDGFVQPDEQTTGKNNK